MKRSALTQKLVNEGKKATVGATEEGRRKAQAFLERMAAEHARWLAENVVRTARRLLLVFADEVDHYHARENPQEKAYYEEEAQTIELQGFLMRQITTSYSYPYARSALYDLTDDELADLERTYDEGKAWAMKRC